MTIETRDELFDDRPAPWRVEKHRMGSASVVDANNYTVLTCNGAALAAFIADAANAFASDEYVFIAANNNAEKIAVLTIQRDEARAQLAAAQARCAELEAALHPFAQWATWADSVQEFDLPDDRVVMKHDDRAITRGDLRRAIAALAGAEPATRGE